MWANTFEGRLLSWNQLRATAQNQALDHCLMTVNNWWFDTPWRPYLLHWDDRANWPDPWQLLEEKQYCSLARGLGILYTICLMDRTDITQAALVDDGNHNLVQVNQEKYILNWDRDQLLNISLASPQIRHSITQEQIKKQIK